MAYLCELGTGQQVYLDNQGQQTIVTTITHSPGQQQQASNSFSTGIWTQAPLIFRTPNGIIIQIKTAQGEHHIQIQGGNMIRVSGISDSHAAQQMQVSEVNVTPVSGMSPMQPMTEMKPMSPMQPMKMEMGDMKMNMNPMQMRMGNMELKMGSTTASKTRFCSQCGTQVQESDRFCVNCGHKLA